MSVLPSLELNWLSRHDKLLLVPTVVFAPNADVAGLYFRPAPCEEIFEGRHVDCRRGIIFVSTSHGGDPASVLAHEWRHHWQHFAGWKYDGVGFDVSLGYEQALRLFFTGSKCERDAYRFERRMVPGAEHHDLWRFIMLS